MSFCTYVIVFDLLNAMILVHGQVIFVDPVTCGFVNVCVHVHVYVYTHNYAITHNDYPTY